MKGEVIVKGAPSAKFVVNDNTDAKFIVNGNTGAEYNVNGMGGVPGADGADGEPGKAATVQVGTVTTGEPGTDAIVTNSGTSSDAILNFTIPRGDPGSSASGEGDMKTSDYDQTGAVKDAGGIKEYVTGAIATESPVKSVNGKTGDVIVDAGGEWGKITGNLSEQTDLQEALDGKQATISDLDAIRSGASAGKTAVQPGDLATVATTGSYNDLSGKPTIPTVGNATLTIQKNGTNVQTFTANATSDKVANITVPTRTSDLTNDSDFIEDASYVHTDNNYTTADKSKLAGIAAGAEVNVQSDWSVTDTSSDTFIKNKPTIPTVNNGTLTIQKNGANIQTFTANSSTNATANITVPTKTSELTNDSDFVAGTDYATASTAGVVKVGSGLAINGGVLSATGGGVADSVAWGNIVGDLSSQTDLQSALNAKQATISDLDAIRSGASAGATAVQPDDLAIVATSGSYSDLTNKPVIDSALSSTSTNAVQNKVVNSALAGKQSTISDLSTIRAGASAGATAVQPDDLATVATTGSYNDLLNKPTIPAEQVNSDWNATSGKAQILNKPRLATVATTGSYNDLSNKPTIPAEQVNSDWNASSGKAQILNKPNLATVATSGAYNDLSGKPTIDATLSTTSTNAVRNSVVTTALNGKQATISDLATIRSGASAGATAVQPNQLATVATSGRYEDLTNKPSIPSKTSELTNDSGFISSIPTASASRLGGVKVGNNLSISADGTLSATASATVDSAYSTTSTNPLQNALTTKASFSKAITVSSSANEGYLVGTISGITELFDGFTINVYFSLNTKEQSGAYQLQLNINNTGDKPIYLRSIYKSDDIVNLRTAIAGVIYTLVYNATTDAWFASNLHPQITENDISSGAVTSDKVNWATLSGDQWPLINKTTSNNNINNKKDYIQYSFTVPASGRYFVSFTQQLGSNAANGYGLTLKIKLGSTTINQSEAAVTGNAAYMYGTVSCVVSANDGQVISCTATGGSTNSASTANGRVSLARIA